MICSAVAGVSSQGCLRRGIFAGVSSPWCHRGRRGVFAGVSSVRGLFAGVSSQGCARCSSLGCIRRGVIAVAGVSSQGCERSLRRGVFTGMCEVQPQVYSQGCHRGRRGVFAGVSGVRGLFAGVSSQGCARCHGHQAQGRWSPHVKTRSGTSPRRSRQGYPTAPPPSSRAAPLGVSSKA